MKDAAMVISANCVTRRIGNIGFRRLVICFAGFAQRVVNPFSGLFFSRLPDHNPLKRLETFFRVIFSSSVRKGRARLIQHAGPERRFIR